MVRMKRKDRCGRLLAGFLAVTAWAVCQAQFAVPADGPVAFRRDRVPLDADTLSGLSRHLTTLARTQPMTSPAERRVMAQLLALAQAVDPGNAASRELLAACRNGSHTPVEDLTARIRSLAKIRQLAGWLKLPEAGGDGLALAACLEDLLAESPQESGAWAGWVPELAAYEPRAAVAEAKPDDDHPQPPPDSAVATVPGLPSARITMLAWKKSGEGSSAEWLPAPATLQMEANPASEPDTPFSIRIYPPGGRNDETARMLEGLMRRNFGELPRGIRVRIDSPDFTELADQRRPLAFSAAAAVLASAALTGNGPDATVLGDVDETGALTLPAAFWDQLLALESGNGERLVLPAAAADVLPSLLATGRPAYFMNHEVLLARDFRHLLDLCAKQPPEVVSAASTKFHAIRDRMGAEDVRSYVANRFVRPRLGELAQEAPYHASAGMLHIQGSGQRPTLVCRMALTSDLTRACKALSWIPRTRGRDLEGWEEDLLGKTLDAFRKRIDELAALAAKTDQDLIEAARILVQPMKDMERALRGRDEYFVKMRAMSKAREDFSRQFVSLEKHLADEAKKLIEP
jgi:hypothetical protein